MFYFSSLVTKGTSDLIRANIYLTPSLSENALKDHLKNDAIVQQIIEASDLVAESNLANECLLNENITFVERIPKLPDLIAHINQGAVIIANVNYWSLLGEDRYYGHFVIIDEIHDDCVLSASVCKRDENVAGLYQFIVIYSGF